MKYLKTFELQIFSKETNNIFHDKNHSCWIIYGDEKKVINVLMEIRNSITQHKNGADYLDAINSIISSISHKKNMIGTYLFFSYSENFEYWEIKDENDKEFILREVPHYTFLGELKLINNKVVLDKMEAETKKYNL